MLPITIPFIVPLFFRSIVGPTSSSSRDGFFFRVFAGTAEP